jgi:two-component system sensor histidine kinase TctE
VPLLFLFLFGALLSVATARYFANLVYDQWLFDSAMTLGSQIRGSGGQTTLSLPHSAVEMLEWDRVDRVLYEVTTAHHGRIFGNASLPHLPNAKTERPVYFNGIVNDYPVRLCAVTIPVRGSEGDTATIVMAETLAKRAAVVRSITAILVPLEGFLLLIAGLSVWIAVISTLKGVERLAGDVARLDVSRLTPLESREAIPGEIAPLVEALNGLVGRLAETRDTLQRFVANAAHQLRTPLAALQLQTQRALRETDPSNRQEALRAIERGTRRLTHLTQQLLTLARSEPSSVRARAPYQVLDLAVLVREEAENWVDTALVSGIDLGYEGPDSGVSVLGDRELLVEMIGNLVDNAIRYGRGGGRVTLKLSQAPTVLAIEDDGPGIPAAEREKVLERFYRLPTSIGEGTGLGLAIASEIAARHGTKLAIEAAASGDGTIVSVRF